MAAGNLRGFVESPVPSNLSFRADRDAVEEILRAIHSSIADGDERVLDCARNAEKWSGQRDQCVTRRVIEYLATNKFGTAERDVPYLKQSKFSLFPVHY